MYPWRENQDPAPRMHYCFLTAFPLSLYPLPSFASNCANLPFVTQEMSWRLASFPCKWTTGDTESLPFLEAPQGPAWFPSPAPCPSLCVCLTCHCTVIHLTSYLGSSSLFFFLVNDVSGPATSAFRVLQTWTWPFLSFESTFDIFFIFSLL